MGIFGALTTAVAGLQAQSYALENISGNIANSQTYGFKRTETSFKDLLIGGSFSPASQVSGSVQAYSRSTNDVQGAVQNASSGTSIAVSGSGFFAVAQSIGDSDGLPQFAGSEVYTRRGDFEFDRNGYLVNGGGYYLKGQPLDSKTGNPVGAASPIKIAKDLFPAAATTSIAYQLNLPSKPQTANYVAGDPSSWLLDSGVGATVTAADSDAFIDSTIEGDSLTVYDAKGEASDLQMRWGKVSNADADATPPTTDTWALFYKSDTNATGADVEWTRVDQTYAFDDAGKLTTPADGNVTIAGLTIDGTSFGDVKMAHGAGLTQYGAASGAASTTELSQDGAASGEMIGVEISDGGLVTATYSNGKTRNLYKIPLVDFPSPNQLSSLDGGAYAATSASGAAFASENGAIVGQAIEQSNVDIADEFTKMIVTQQAYSANTRVVSTSDTMMQETLNMIR
ncbi:flagellar hook protein FlgE [Methylopila sp. M107]|uniref:flagellar hook protein FlgE n=1 Tax=Methylopila sp. M107 TaxID=1101190 RepID=UPI00036D6841|nr:flagellar hook protein FlgE [Methylopila sp. M107]